MAQYRIHLHIETVIRLVINVQFVSQGKLWLDKRVALFVTSLSERKFMSDKYICTSCGRTGKPKKVNKGSLLIEIILWWFILIPGIIYGIWRRTNRQQVCPYCNIPTMIPVNSPVGQKMLNARGQTDEVK